MTYIILRDTFGGGLKTIYGIGLEVFSGDQLGDWIISAAGVIAEEDGYEDLKSYIDDHKDLPIEETLVICEIKAAVREHPGSITTCSEFIRNAIKNHMDKETKEQYALYLKLKEKFENV